MSKSGRYAGLTIHTSPCPAVARTQHVNYGGTKTAHGAAKAINWKTRKCRECAGPVYVVRHYKDNADKWICPECKKKGRTEVIKAVLALAKRKKEMGIKW